MTRAKRIFHSAMLTILPTAHNRTKYMKKHHLFGLLGEGVSIQRRKLPLYSNLIFIHDNVKIASNVGFLTHDIIHTMLNGKFGGGGILNELAVLR